MNLPKRNRPFGSTRLLLANVRLQIRLITAIAMMLIGSSCSSDQGSTLSPLGLGPTATGLTEPITRGDLVKRERFVGTVQANGSQPLPAGLAGTATWVPEVGAELTSGDLAFRIDDRPVILVSAKTPFYRGLGLGDQGDDVAQLQRILNQLTDADLEIDGDFGPATTAAWTGFIAGHGEQKLQTMPVGMLITVAQAQPWAVADVDLQHGFPVTPSEAAITIVGQRKVVTIEGDDLLPTNAVATIDDIGELGTARFALNANGTVLYEWDLPVTADVTVNQRLSITIETVTSTDVFTVPVASLHQGSTGDFFIRCGSDGSQLHRCDVDVAEIAGIRAVITGEAISETMIVEIP